MVEQVADADGLALVISRLARQIAGGGALRGPLRLVGVRSRGYPLAVRLASELEPLVGTEVEVGAVDITLYRDDLDQADRWPVLRGTEIPFDVDGSDLVLVDDVLYTGRTVRAALNAVCDLGRPARVRLVVLVDRGHRELPIQADYVGMTLDTERDERVAVHLSPTDPVEEIVRVRLD
ncbi:MAG: bifunctional pyr operon transcriptional regulator/uracil phosphoribosyltransferase PyrR [Isosphaeraceae bacterium]